MLIVEGKTGNRCTVCRRNKNRAIKEQLHKMEICGVEQCLFKEQISNYIAENNKSNLVRFELSKKTVLEGEKIQVYWEVNNSKKITILGYNTYSKSIGVIDIVINETKEIILQIEYPTGGIYESRQTVECYKKPIFNFNTLKNTVKKNNTFLINWNVEHHEQIILKNIDNEVINIFVNEKAFRTSNLIETTTYIFEIVGKFGYTIYETITIEVINEVIILNFRASPDFVTEMIMPITLSWNVENADKIVINDIGDVSNDISVIVNPISITTYTLTASNEFYSTDMTIDINYRPLNLKVPTSIFIPAPEFKLRTNFPIIKGINQIPSPIFPTFIKPNISVNTELTKKINGDFQLTANTKSTLTQRWKHNYEWTKNILKNSNYQLSFHDFVRYKIYGWGIQLQHFFSKKKNNSK